MRVLVTGGAGYIGSVVTEQLVKDNHEVVVYDSLYKGHREAVVTGARFVEADLRDKQTLVDTLRDVRIEAVVHMAADSLVGESYTDPAKYYDNNVGSGLVLLDAMRATDVHQIVFSSTAAVYGEPEKQPIEESDATNPTNPYGETKLAFERAMHWYERAYGLRYASLRYFNAAGASENCGEIHDPETHLIPIALQTAAGKRSQVDIFGDDYPTEDGTCVRDYIHVVDLARAHIMALDVLSDGSRIYNLGCGGAGYSVREVIETARQVTGKDIPTKIGPRRAGDPAVLIASSEKIKRELGWLPMHQDLRVIIESAWAWMRDGKGRKGEEGKR
ncbi:MAG TPA: UDP-glucose 4-epimerase GalE [Pyrinomonadaceae bacterium]|nr:UDP-glucose 4-epimerase GalE [Pyrinomonadaceae bacterium]